MKHSGKKWILLKKKVETLGKSVLHRVGTRLRVSQIFPYANIRGYNNVNKKSHQFANARLFVSEGNTNTMRLNFLAMCWG